LHPPSHEHPLTHLVLSPKSHHTSTLEFDEYLQLELRNFQKSLIAFYLEKFDMHTVFIETSIQSEHHVPHCMIECVGIPSKDDTDFEVYFQKSFLDDDSEWGTHRKIIDTKPKKG
jgi:Protein similar to CwfJ C-terminus 1